MYTYLHIYIYVCIYIYTYMYLYLYMYVYIYMYIYICICLFCCCISQFSYFGCPTLCIMCIYIYIYIHIFTLDIHMFSCVCNLKSMGQVSSITSWEIATKYKKHIYRIYMFISLQSEPPNPKCLSRSSLLKWQSWCKTMRVSRDLFLFHHSLSILELL